MKKLFFGILLLSVFGANAQLNEYSLYLINYYNVDFEMTIKFHALKEYENNKPMSDMEINDQSESLIKIVEIYNFDYKEVFLHAIAKWSYDGYEDKNLNTFKNTNKVSIGDLLKLHCNWVDVLYEMKRQKKIKEKKKKNKS